MLKVSRKLLLFLGATVFIPNDRSGYYKPTPIHPLLDSSETTYTVADEGIVYHSVFRDDNDFEHHWTYLDRDKKFPDPYMGKIDIMFGNFDSYLLILPNGQILVEHYEGQ